MNAKSRRKIEMGRSALGFSIAHPDASPGYATTLARLEDRLARANKLIDLQRDGFAQVRGATVQKRDLRRLMRRAQLRHVVQVAAGAANEVPEIRQKFLLPLEQSPYLEFQAAAHALVAEAQQHKELLVKHGLAETLLDDLVENLKQFDNAVDQGTESRRAHVSASAEFDVIGDEIVHLVKVMDGLNRSRFADADQVLAEWESASNVFGPVRPAAEKPEQDDSPGTDVKPAA
ncbi:MAG: hypothetical protein ACREMZ_15070 [Gemmatimonadales bacterium]